MSSGISKDVGACEKKNFAAMTRTEAVNTILKRTTSLERFLVHKNPASLAISKFNGIEDESEEPAAFQPELGRRCNVVRSELEYGFDAVALKHRQIIALVNKELNNIFRYTLEMRLKILNEHRQEFQIDIKTIEEYLFLLRQLDLVDYKDVARKIDTALKLMTESSTMRSNIETRIQEVDDFLSETSEKLDLRIRSHMMVDLGVRHGAYGSALTLRDHDRFPQLKYCHLLDVKSLEQQVSGTKIVFRQSGL